MPDRISQVEERVRRLEETVVAIGERLAALEFELRPGEARGPAPATAAEHAPSPATDAVGLLSLVGRTFIVFGGAFLLRALTESGYLPTSAGVMAGLAYAAIWLVAADRANGASGVFHGLAALLIGLPLIGEATLRFQTLSSIASASVLAALSLAALTIAWHRHLAALAGLATLGLIVTAVPLALLSAEWWPFGAALVVVGAVVPWVGESQSWHWLAWPVALVADGLAGLIVVRASADPPREPIGLTMAVLTWLVVTYLGPVAVWFWRGRSLRVFDMVQASLVGLTAVAGAATVLRAHDLPTGSIGLLSLGAGAIAWAGAWLARGRHRVSHGSFLFVFSFGVALVISGSALLTSAPILAVGTAVGALLLAALAPRTHEAICTLDGGVALIVAGVASGLVAVAGTLWLGAVSSWPSLGPSAWIATVAAFVFLVMPRDPAGGRPSALWTIAEIFAATLLIVGAGSVLLRVVGQTLAGTPADPGVLATSRSVVLAGAAMLLPLAARLPRLAPLRWFVYPVLVAGGVKLLVDDFPHSRPATLFVALAAYGVALAVAPRLRKSTS
ncbi:MAG TPA: hypothetical protein VLT86_12930 [Vicinamibacterales bacterium]|nr:hypothetical protein [Vicinamibacterales bacterium]